MTVPKQPKANIIFDDGKANKLKNDRRSLFWWRFNTAMFLFVINVVLFTVSLPDIKEFGNGDNPMIAFTAIFAILSLGFLYAVVVKSLDEFDKK